MTRLLIALIRVYQRLVSPLLPPTCRYTPTCSSYFIEALRRKGLLRGTVKGCLRILRCNPFFPGGHDPVEPEAEGPGPMEGPPDPEAPGHAEGPAITEGPPRPAEEAAPDPSADPPVTA